MRNDVKGHPATPRKARAAATRRRIIEAATTEFVTNGYQGAMMAAIAARAGVAVQTVYFVFHTKSELFAAALDAAVLGPEGVPPMEQAWIAEAAASPAGAVAALRSFIRGSAPIFKRASALSEVAGAAAVTDPELAAVFHAREDLRIEGYRDFLRKLVLPPGVDPQRAADVLIALHSPVLYQALRRGRGWSDDEVSEWMAASIPELVVQPAPATPDTAVDVDGRGRPR